MASKEMSFENVDRWWRTDDGRTTDGRQMPAYTISSTMSLQLRWAKNLFSSGIQKISFACMMRWHSCLQQTATFSHWIFCVIITQSLGSRRMLIPRTPPTKTKGNSNGIPAIPEEAQPRPRRIPIKSSGNSYTKLNETNTVPWEFQHRPSGIPKQTRGIPTQNQWSYNDSRQKENSFQAHRNSKYRTRGLLFLSKFKRIPV